MKLLPTTADSDFFVVEFFIMVGIVLVPAVIILLVWVLFLRNKRRRKRKRRHEHREMNTPPHRHGALPPIRQPGNFTDQPKP